MSFTGFLETNGQIFQIERNGSIIGCFKGLESTEQKGHIGYVEDADIQVKDYLISPADKRFFVENVVAPMGIEKIRRAICSTP